MYYALLKKQFTRIEIVDNNYMVVLKELTKGDYTIFATKYVDDYLIDKKELVYVAKKGNITAHGTTIKKAIADVEFKRLSSLGAAENFKRIKEQGYMTASDYRLITGACEQGTQRFLTENNLSFEDKKTIEEVAELAYGQFGSDVFIKLMEELS